MAGNLTFNVDANDRASGEFAAIASQLEALGRELDKIDGRNVRAKIDLNAPAAAQIARIDQLRAALAEIDGKNAKARVEITGTPGPAEVRQLRAAAKALRELDDINVNSAINITGNLPDPKDLRASARALKQLQDIGSVHIHVSVTGAVTALADIAALRRELRGLPNDTTVKVKADADANGIEKVARALLSVKGAAVLLAPALLGSAIPAVATLGGSLVSLAGLAPIAVGALAAGGIVAAGFGVAMAGASKQATAFQKALDPLQRSLAGIENKANARLFDGLAAPMRVIAQEYAPVLTRGLVDIAGGLNLSARGVLDFVKQGQTVRDVNLIFANTNAALRAAAPSAANLLAAFTDIATVGSNDLPALATSLNAATARFREFIAQARESGKLGEWIDNGITTLKTLGSIAGNVGSSLASVFRAAKASGADFLGTLDRATERVAVFLKSAQGQSTLVAMFREARSAIDALTPGVAALGVALTTTVAQFSSSGALTNVGQVFSQIGTAVAPLVAQLGALAGGTLNNLANGARLAVTALTPMVSAISGLLSALGPVAPAVLATVVAFVALGPINTMLTALGASIAGMALKIGVYTTALSGSVAVGTAAASAVNALGVALRFAGTAIPIIGAVVVALSLLAGGEKSAADAARDHQTAVEGVKATLDKYTGSVTAATVAEQAKDIAARKLSDGTTSFATALARAGISLQDYTQAASGNTAALEKVNAQLFIGAKAALQNSTEWNQNKSTYQAAGVTLDLLTAAAIGNVQAQEQVQAKLDATGKGWRDWSGAVASAVGPLSDLGSALGEYSGTVAEAQQQTRDAALAVKDFGTTLGTIKDGLGGLADGAAQTDVLKAGFRDLAVSAADAATKAGSAAEKIGGVAAGASAAASSMQKSRDAFIEAATAAGLTRDQAAALADQIGLIPAAAKVNFTSNATGVAAEMNTLAAQVAAVPGAKQITVQALSDEAKAKLVDLGFTVTTLPNGQVGIDVHDEAGRAKLNDFLVFASGQVTILQIDANPDPATGKINATVQLGNGQIARMTLDANPDPATGKINATVDLGNGKTARITLDGNPDPVTGKINAVVDLGNGKHTVITIDPRDLATPVINAIPRNITTTVTINTIYSGSSPAAVRLAGSGGLVAGYSGGGIYGGGPDKYGRVTRYAGGGVVPGYAPGVDDQLALISRGEAVLVPEAVRALGASRIMAMNREMSGGRPGTVTGSIAGMMDGTIRGAGPAAGVMDIRRGAVGASGAGSYGSSAALISEVRGLRSDNTQLRGALERMEGAIQKQRPFVVEDRSGNPVETARATALALAIA